jgi:hypothetical protein
VVAFLLHRCKAYVLWGQVLKSEVAIWRRVGGCAQTGYQALLLGPAWLPGVTKARKTWKLPKQASGKSGVHSIHHHCCAIRRSSPCLAQCLCPPKASACEPLVDLLACPSHVQFKNRKVVKLRLCTGGQSSFVLHFRCGFAQWVAFVGLHSKC